MVNLYEKNQKMQFKILKFFVFFKMLKPSRPSKYLHRKTDTNIINHQSDVTQACVISNQNLGTKNTEQSRNLGDSLENSGNKENYEKKFCNPNIKIENSINYTDSAQTRTKILRKTIFPNVLKLKNNENTNPIRPEILFRNVNTFKTLKESKITNNELINVCNQSEERKIFQSNGKIYDIKLQFLSNRKKKDIKKEIAFHKRTKDSQLVNQASPSSSHRRSIRYVDTNCDFSMNRSPNKKARRKIFG
ncbi:hypothetical protein EDEG_03205 [Edhazardia aedis USNM 41457]|uniref:Uncharacterized protein n=1 Tax=Edhazardia aedis (strain USNM 41457) TaxID=1003232 RepID=J8ZRP1_EDHAE|nr:hypothetical protein EDEG_03205 [Edhazardia aedis USNM 41457]|eukprot:EJW02363.1 hypothetical protein EDEG_03205 [Edhazardia aedis USNM 41457]